MNFAACLLLAVACVAMPSATRAQASFFERLSVTHRRLERLEASTSADERTELARRLYLGPAAIVAPTLGRMLATEAEPSARLELLRATTRLAISTDDSALDVVVPALIALCRAGTERQRAAQTLAAIGSDEAMVFLIGRLGEPSVREALRWTTDESVVDRIADAARAGPVALLPDHVAALETLGRPSGLAPLLSWLGTHPDADPLVARAIGAILRTSEVSSEERAVIREALTARVGATEDARALAALLDALGETGPMSRADVAAQVIATRLGDADSTVAESALRALALSAPEAAVDALIVALDGTPEARAIVRTVLARSTAPALVRLARAIVEREPEGADLLAALDFLARADRGAGIEVLSSSDVLVQALAARRAPEHPLAADVRARLAEGDATVLSALASGRAPPWPADEATLEATRDARRAAAMAYAVGGPPSADALEAIVAATTDRVALAWLCEAARRHRVALSSTLVRALLERTSHRGPDYAAVLGLVPFARDAHALDERALRQAMSGALADARPIVRAAAAMALAASPETSAHPSAHPSAGAIEALLEDRHPGVRIAAAQALVALEPTRRAAVLARAAVDGDARAIRVLEAIGRGRERARADVLVVRTVEHRPGHDEPIWLEVRTDDGLWRHLPVVENGIFVLPDVPGPNAEVSIVLD